MSNAEIYFIPLVICLIAGWGIQAFSKNDTDGIGKLIAAFGFVPILNIVTALFVLFFAVIAIVCFLVVLPSILRGK